MAKRTDFFCRDCGHGFRSKCALLQHRSDKHTKLADMPDVGKEGAKAILDGMDDLPDGAYFQMAEDLGLDIDDL